MLTFRSPERKSGSTVLVKMLSIKVPPPILSDINWFIFFVKNCCQLSEMMIDEFILIYCGMSIDNTFLSCLSIKADSSFFPSMHTVLSTAVRHNFDCLLSLDFVCNYVALV